MSRETPVHLNPNMDFQDKYKPQASSDFFEDGRASRMPPKNTLPRATGDLTVVQADWGSVQTMNEFRELVDKDRYLKTNVALWCGKTEGTVQNCAEEKGPWVSTIPISVLESRKNAKNVEAEAFVRRGQTRYNIYCAPCHGAAGYGQGKVAIRSDYAIAPPNFHAPEYGLRAAGEIFHAITYGRGSMSHYRTQIPDPLDRWAIVNYVRALQYSQNYEANRVRPKAIEPPKAPVVIPQPEITNPLELERIRQAEADAANSGEGAGDQMKGAPPSAPPTAAPGVPDAPAQPAAPGGAGEGTSGATGAVPTPMGAPSTGMPPAAPAGATPAAPAAPPAGAPAPQTPKTPVIPAPAAAGANDTK